MVQLDSIFNAKSVAVIGASNNKGKVGYVVLKNIIDFGFLGDIFPINLCEKEILGLKCYPTVLDVAQEIDLAVFVVPAQTCLQIAEECGEKGIKNLVIITAGFKEIGIEGAKLEKELLKICKKYNINVLGPNVVGYIDTQRKLNASFTNMFPRSGNIALISQSGAIITSSIDWSILENIGFSKIISLGNKIDLNETDFLEALAEDPNTKVILMYIESIDEGQRFIEIARSVVKRKPIIAIKAGISDAGARAASSHTGALAGSKIAYYTAFRKCGIIQAKNLEDLFNYGIALSTQRAPTENSIVIITNAGGAGILATDAAEEAGLQLASFTIQEIEQLRGRLPKAASIYNPIDILGDAKSDRYSYVLNTCMNFESVKGFIVLMSPQAVTEFNATTNVIIDFYSQNPDKPLVVSYLGGISNKEAMQRLRQHGIPCFNFPQDAVQAMAGLYTYSRILKRGLDTYEQFEVDNLQCKNIFLSVLKDNRLVLLESEAMQVAKCYGLPIPETCLARTPEEAIQLADEMGYPVVLKISSPEILHKSDFGAIIMDINNSEEVRRSYNTITRRISKRMPSARINGVTVQKMITKKGKEIIIGARKDPQFGHLIMCGLGGIYVNFLEDVAFRINPISRREALEMLSETKVYKLLRGVRGEPPSDIQRLIDMILRISQLLADHPFISELDINPLLVYPEKEGVITLDIKITLKSEE
ncbi:MAG: acetate--CoA ligase alpha subunit [Promethearchaeota archaeon]